MHPQLTGPPAPGAAPAAQGEPPRPAAVTVAGLRKSYGSVRAVRDVSFSVQTGEIVALLGPERSGQDHRRWRSWKVSAYATAARSEVARPGLTGATAGQPAAPERSTR